MAVAEARRVGLVKLNRNGPLGEGMHLEALWVAPGSRRERVGESLVSALETTAAAMGAQEIRLWVFDENRLAQDFYMRLGYTGPLKRQQIKANGRLRYEEEYAKLLKPASSSARLVEPPLGGNNSA
jgi:ribosomal protein S18 acetylase RimI-like enzyme